MASTHILAVGRIEHGEIEMEIAMPPLILEQPVDGLLQDAIDYAAETADYQDYLADVEWLRTGC